MLEIVLPSNLVSYVSLVSYVKVIPEMTKHTKNYAILKAIGIGVLLAPVLGVVWVLLWGWMYFGNGGDFGGFGAAPSDPAWWVDPATFLLLVCALLLEYAAMAHTYRKEMARSGAAK